MANKLIPISEGKSKNVLVPISDEDSGGMEQSPSNDISVAQMMASGPSAIGTPTGEMAGFHGSKVPSAAHRSWILGQGYRAGANNPSEVPTFSDAFGEGRGENPSLAGVMSAPHSTVGGMLDAATNPLEILSGMALMSKPITRIGAEMLKKISGVKIGSIPKALGPSKPTSENMKSTINLLGRQTKEVEMQTKAGVEQIKAATVSQNQTLKSNLKIQRANQDEQMLKNTLSTENRVNQLETSKAKVIDSQSQKIQQKLGMKASNKLNEGFGAEYREAVKGEFIDVDNATTAFEKVLKNRGVLRPEGNKLVVDASIELSPDEQQVLGLYQKLKARTPNDVIRLDVDRIPVEQFDKSLQKIFSGARGKQYGSGQNMLTDLRYETADMLPKTRALRARWRPDYQSRNAVNMEYRVFSKKGTEGVNTTPLNTVLDPSNPQSYRHQRMMDFIAKYTGEDPSKPVKQVAGRITELNTQLDSARTQLNLGKFVDDRSLATKQAENMTKAEDAINALMSKSSGKQAELAQQISSSSNTMESLKLAEASSKFKKRVAWTAGGLVAAGTASKGKKIAELLP